MPVPPRPPTPPFGAFHTREVDALWRARDEDRAEVKDRFGRLEAGVQELRGDVGEVKIAVDGILTTEQQRTASAEKRNARIWQLFSGFLVSLAVAIVIALWKVFAPIAIGGIEGRAPTVNQQVDSIRETLGRNH